MTTPLTRKQLELSETALANRLLVTFDEACHLLCLSRNTVKTLPIPVVRLKRLRLYDVADLRDWIESAKS